MAFQFNYGQGNNLFGDTINTGSNGNSWKSMIQLFSQLKNSGWNPNPQPTAPEQSRVTPAPASGPAQPIQPGAIRTSDYIKGSNVDNAGLAEHNITYSPFQTGSPAEQVKDNRSCSHLSGWLKEAWCTNGKPNATYDMYKNYVAGGKFRT